jgi:hypothetical protein
MWVVGMGGDGLEGGVGSPSAAAELAAELDALAAGDVVTVTSFDAWERCFDHRCANALGRCGIEGRLMFKRCERAKAAWETLTRRSAGGANPAAVSSPPPVARAGGGVSDADQAAATTAAALAAAWATPGPLDARPEGTGHAVAAVGVVGRRPWGRTVLVEKLGVHAPTAELALPMDQIEEAQIAVERREAEDAVLGRVAGVGVGSGRAVGACRVLTPSRWTHEANSGAAYNQLPGHAVIIPRVGGAAGAAGAMDTR